jgi:hypothetical protein
LGSGGFSRVSEAAEDVDVDLVNLDDRNVDQDVRALGSIVPVERGIVGKLLTFELPGIPPSVLL